MRIKQKLSQNRRDFRAIFECEHCGSESTFEGYDDANYHQNVIPKIKCGKCGKISPESYEPEKTRYPEGYQI